MTNRSRRQLMKVSGAALASALTTSIAGCTTVSDSLPSIGSPSDMEKIPEDVDVVARGDVEATLEDDAVTTFVNRYLEIISQDEYYEGPEDKEDVLDEFEDETDLELQAADTAMGFSKYPPEDQRDYDPYIGLWLETDWSEDDVVDSLEDQGLEFDETTHEDETLYEPDQEYQTLYMGSLGSGEYVLGTEDAVEEAIEVYVDETDSVDDDFADAFDETADEPFRFVGTVPEGRLPSDSVDVGGDSVNPQDYATVNYVAGTAYHDGDDVGVTVKLLTESESDATDVKQGIEGAISATKAEVEDEDAEDALDSLEVSRDGAIVVVEAAKTVEEATELLEKVARRMVGVESQLIPQE